MLEIENLENIISDYDCFIFDCDGVLYQEGQEIGQAFKQIQRLMDQDKKVFFLTNSSGYTRLDVIKKLKKMGCQADLHETQVYSSSHVTSCYLAEKHPEIKNYFVLGRDSIRKQLNLQGIDSIGGTMKDLGHCSVDEILSIPREKDVGGVIVGLDTEVTFTKMALASLYLQDPKVKLFATNDDSFDMVKGKRIPGAGLLLQGLLAGLRDPSNPLEKNLKEPVILGKPNPYAWELIKREHDLPNRTRALMIGDRLDTDIKFGNRAGIDTCLVMTGCTNSYKQIKMHSGNAEMQPKYVLSSVDAGLREQQEISKRDDHREGAHSQEVTVGPSMFLAKL